MNGLEPESRGNEDLKCLVCGSSDYSYSRKAKGLRMGACLNCGFAYSRPLITGGENELWNANSTVTSTDYYTNILSTHAIQSSLARLKAPLMKEYWRSIIGRTPLSILEIGCGTGQYYLAFKDIGVEWTGFEVNKKMIDFCQTNNIPVKKFNIMSDSKKNWGKYDVVFLSQVLEHILTPHIFLSKIKDYMADGGILHIDVPNHDSLTSLYRRVNPFCDEYGFIQPTHHLVAYTQNALSHLLNVNAFHICHIGAYTNDHKIFGQLLASKSALSRLSFLASKIMGRGSLLVCVAKIAEITNDAR